MAGVRASIPAKGWLQQPNPAPDQQLTLLPPPLIRPRHEYDRLGRLLSRNAPHAPAALIKSPSAIAKCVLPTPEAPIILKLF